MLYGFGSFYSDFNWESLTISARMQGENQLRPELQDSASAAKPQQNLNILNITNDGENRVFSIFCFLHLFHT